MASLSDVLRKAGNEFYNFALPSLPVSIRRQRLQNSLMKYDAAFNAATTGNFGLFRRPKWFALFLLGERERLPAWLLLQLL
jgi:hypothetical protein